MNDTGGGVTTEHRGCDPVMQEPVTICDSRTVISNRHKNLESARALFFPSQPVRTHWRGLYCLLITEAEMHFDHPMRINRRKPMRPTYFVGLNYQPATDKESQKETKSLKTLNYLSGNAPC